MVSRILQRNSVKYRNNVAIKDRDREYAYGELKERADRLAGALNSLGVGKEDRVAVLVKNSVEFVDVVFASIQLGAVVVPINFRLVEREIEYILRDSGAKIIICEPEYISMLLNLKPSLQKLSEVIATRDAVPGVLEYGNLLQGDYVCANQRAISPDDLLYLMYTSGTTGMPKGAMLTNQNVFITALSLSVGLGLDSSFKMLLAAPLFHAGPNVVMISTLLLGGSVLLHRDFVPSEILRTISEERVNGTFLAPTMIQALLMVPEVKNTKFDSFKQLIYGAAPIPEALQQQAREVFGCQLVQGYGLTESYGVLGLLLPADHSPDHPGAGCREWLHCSVRIVDEQGKDVPVGEVGEIVASGPNIMQGYWNIPEETSRAMKGGWLHTGDLGRMDRDGFIYIVDRKKDMIITGGENVYPVEVELVLSGHPAVAQAAVIGVPDQYWGESVKALVVLKKEDAANEQELIEFCRARLAKYKCPKTVEFRTALPITASGKIQKNILREEFHRGTDEVSMDILT